MPKRSLTHEARRRAWDTIDELGLNKLDVKIHRMERVQQFWNEIFVQPFSERQNYIDSRMTEPMEHLGTIGMLVAQLRRDGRI